MATVVGGLWVIATLLLSVLLLGQTLFGTSSVQGAALLVASRTAVERARTAISIANATSADVGSGTDVTVTANNTGGVSIFKASQMDMLIRYTAVDSSLVVRRLTYSTSCALTEGQWCLNTLTPDSFNPGAWDPGELAQFKLRLVPAVQCDTTLTVVAVAPNGISGLGNFTRVCN